MSVDVTNETQWVIDPKVFSDLGIWVLDQMRVSTQSDLTIMFVDPDPIAELHMRWMNLEGPTDVMSFPMDELRPGDGKTVMEGVLGDIVICPWVAAQQAAAAGHSTMQEMLLLTIHGILHLLGYDHIDDVTIGYDMRTNQKVHILSGVIQNEWKARKWSFLLGGRFDHHNTWSTT